MRELDAIDQAKLEHIKAAYPKHPINDLIEWVVWHNGPAEACTARYAAWFSGLSIAKQKKWERGESIFRKFKRTRSTMV